MFLCRLCPGGGEKGGVRLDPRVEGQQTLSSRERGRGKGAKIRDKLCIEAKTAMGEIPRCLEGRGRRL